MNGGYVALAVVGVVFFGLQFWWIGMTFRNARNQRFLVDQKQIEEVKQRLEKIFSNNN